MAIRHHQPDVISTEPPPACAMLLARAAYASECPVALRGPRYALRTHNRSKPKHPLGLVRSTLLRLRKAHRHPILFGSAIEQDRVGFYAGAPPREPGIETNPHTLALNHCPTPSPQTREPAEPVHEPPPCSLAARALVTKCSTPSVGSFTEAGRGQVDLGAKRGPREIDVVIHDAAHNEMQCSSTERRCI